MSSYTAQRQAWSLRSRARWRCVRRIRRRAAVRHMVATAFVPRPARPLTGLDERAALASLVIGHRRHATHTRAHRIAGMSLGGFSLPVG